MDREQFCVAEGYTYEKRGGNRSQKETWITLGASTPFEVMGATLRFKERE